MDEKENKIKSSSTTKKFISNTIDCRVYWTVAAYRRRYSD